MAEAEKQAQDLIKQIQEQAEVDAQTKLMAAPQKEAASEEEGQAPGFLHQTRLDLNKVAEAQE